jgi:hypothetical protein
MQASGGDEVVVVTGASADDAEDRGAFDDRSQAGSDQWWANTHPGLIAGVATGLVAAAHAVVRKC